MINMALHKGRKKPEGSTRPFQKGHDPRRHMSGAPKSDVRVSEIKSELKLKLAESLKEYYDLPVLEMIKRANDPSMTVGERIALRFLAETANRGDPARVSLLLKVLGLEVEKHEVSVSTSLEQLVLEANKE